MEIEWFDIFVRPQSRLRFQSQLTESSSIAKSRMSLCENSSVSCLMEDTHTNMKAEHRGLVIDAFLSPPMGVHPLFKVFQIIDTFETEGRLKCSGGWPASVPVPQEAHPCAPNPLKSDSWIPRNPNDVRRPPEWTIKNPFKNRVSRSQSPPKRDISHDSETLLGPSSLILRESPFRSRDHSQ
jgi:hypothetical protein